ncbi:MAG: hypothetical protein KDJ88_16355 [Bauldia sp.]|nr:hypothetical protein [Bauldia sp.]
MKAYLIVAMTGLIAGCATTNSSAPTGPEQGIWLRTDGQSGRNNPVLAQQFEVDKAACTYEGQVNQLCMTHRGYILVPQSQVEAKAAELRAAAEARGATY